MDRITPHILMNGAEQFLHAATKVCPRKRNDELRFKINFVAYFLLGHSIELSLKAFLLCRGVELNVLKYKPYSHDLDKLICEARKRKLGLQVKLKTNEVKLIKLLSLSYSAKLLEYTETGYYKLPEYTLLWDIANNLVTSIRPYAYGKTYTNKTFRVAGYVTPPLTF
jgi:hypothetical protein